MFGATPLYRWQLAQTNQTPRSRIRTNRPAKLFSVRTILMLRHGETDWNATHRWQGWTDVPLNEHGRQQAHIRAQQMQRDGFEFQAVASSDLSRAHETAAIIAEHLRIGHHIVDEGFRERFGGDWQGKSRLEIEKGWPEALELWKSGRIPGPPNAEPLSVMISRFRAAVAAMHAVVAPGPVCLVTHGGVHRAVATDAGFSMSGVLNNLEGTWAHYDGNALTFSADGLSAPSIESLESAVE